MDDLVQWLRAQLDDDERIARAAKPGPWHADGGVYATHPTDEVVDYSESAEHIARHDPARVLREIDAKRRILYLAVQLPKVTSSTDMFDNNRDAWAEVLKQLALPYAARPGYREEWRP